MKLVSKLLTQLLIVSMLLLPFSTQAGMINTDQAVASAQDIANRDMVRDFVSRSDVVKQFEMLGINSTNAQQRVDAMTQQEINTVAGKIDALPAGAITNWGWAGIVAVIGLVIYFMWYRT